MPKKPAQFAMVSRAHSGTAMAARHCSSSRAKFNCSMAITATLTRDHVLEAIARLKASGGEPVLGLLGDHGLHLSPVFEARKDFGFSLISMVYRAG